MASYSFPKIRRLLNRKDFVNLNRTGNRYQTTHFTALLRQNRLGITRLGITVNRKMGNAVQRNRIKRLIREFFRLHESFFPQGYDMVIVAKQGASDLDFWEIKEELGEFILDKKLRI